MNHFSSSIIKNLLLSSSFIVAASLSGCALISQQANSSSAHRATDEQPRLANGAELLQPESPAPDNQGALTLFGLPFLRLEYLFAVSLSIGILAFLFAWKAWKNSNEVAHCMAQLSVALDATGDRLDVLTDKPGRYDDEYRRQLNELLIRISRLEAQIQDQRLYSSGQTTVHGQASSSPSIASTPLSRVDDLTALIAQATPSFVVAAPPPPPAPDTVRLPAPTGPSKSTLIEALNSGNRQQLKAAAKAELNITRDYESAHFSGRSMRAELEEVNAGGSYWLIEIDGQHWLFPTDKTLRGIAEIGQDKGMYILEKQTIAQSQLLEPALLERTGSTWSLISSGTVAVP
jgi:hypothetical protein